MKKSRTKRLISVLLAGVMLLTSLSTCFTAFAASSSYFQYVELANALNDPAVQNATWPQAQSSGPDSQAGAEDRVTVSDPTGAITRAAEAFWSAATTLAPDHMTQGQTGNNNTLMAIKQEILTNLQGYGIQNMSSAQKALDAFTAYQNGGGDVFGGNLQNPPTPAARYYVFEIDSGTVADQLLGYDSVDDIPDSLPGSLVYSWYHDAQNIGGFIATRNRVLGSYTRSEQPGSDTIPQALKNFDAFFAENLDKDLTSMTGDELTALHSEAQAQVDALNAVGIWGNDEVMDHFFDKDAIQNFVNDTATQADVAYAAAALQLVKDNMDKTPDPAALDDAEALAALEAEVTPAYNTFTSYSETAQAAALERLGLEAQAVAGYVEAVRVENAAAQLQLIKTSVDALIASVPEDLTQATDEQLTAALAQAKDMLSQIALYNVQAAVDRVFPNGTDYILDFIQNVTVEMQARELNTEIANYGAYFRAHMAVDLTTVSTDSLLDDYRTPDNAKFKELNDNYAREAIDQAYGADWYPAVEEYLASIDTVLTGRVKAQIDTAIENYEDFGTITNLNARKVAAAIGNVETRIIDELGMPDGYQSKYDQLAGILEEYNAFMQSVQSGNVTNWQKGEVSYPSRTPMANDIARDPSEVYNVTEENVNTVITAIDQLMHNMDLSEVLGLEQTVSDLIKSAVDDNLYTNEMVNTIISGIYGALVNALSNVDLGDIGGLIGVSNGAALIDLLGQIGLYIYPSKVADAVGTYPYSSAYSALKNAGTDWNNFSNDTDWNVTDRESFVAAVSTALGGLTPILKVALTNQNLADQVTVKALGIINVTADVNITAMDIYSEDLLPLLELLGCTGLTKADTYNGYTTSKELLTPVLTSVLSLVDTLANAPLDTLLDLLPKLAYVMEFDLISSHLKNISLDGSIKGSVIGIDIDLSLADILGGLLGGTDMYSILSNLLSGTLDMAALSDLNVLLPAILGLVAPDANLVLPTIDQTHLASLGTLQTGVASVRPGGTRTEYVADKPAVFVSVLRYVLPMLGDQDFMDSLFALIGNMTGSEIALGDDIMGILKNLGDTPDNVICALTELFVPQTYATQKYNYKYTENAGTPVTTVEYTEDWTKEKAQYIADNLSPFVDNMMEILGGEDMASLGDLIRGYITDLYTNETINSLVITVRDALNGLGIDLAPVLSLVGVDLSGWDSVTETTNWGVLPGDKVTFAQGLSEALEPVVPILGVLLTGQDLTILDAVQANGYNGYANGIIPLLENLGCDPADIRTPQEYADDVAADPANALNDILTPLLNLVEEIYDDPINKLVEILPNILYFLDCGGLQTAVENTAQAVFVLLDTVRPIYDLNFNLNLNLQQILVDLLANLEINGQPLKLTVPFLNDLSMLMVGTVTEYTSKSGEQAYMLMDTDKADFVTVLLRNVVDVLFYADNINAIADLIAGMAKMDDETKENLKSVLNTFAEQYKQENGVDKVLSAAYTIFEGLSDASGSITGTLGDFNERWSAVFEALYNSGDEGLRELAKLADEALDWLTFGFVTGEGVGTAGLIDFFERLSAFFSGKVTDVSISQTEAEVAAGQSITLELSFKPITAKNKNATWTSSDPSVATVENGVVTGVESGDAMITAVTEDGNFEVSCLVHVRADKSPLAAMLKRVDSLGLSEENLALIADAMDEASRVMNDEFATQAEINAATAALMAAVESLNLGSAVTDVTIMQNGEAVGEVVYQKVPWTKRWNSTPAALDVAITGDYKEIRWEYANWSVDSPEADIEASADGLSANIVAKNSVVGAHSCWIQVAVTDVYGNTVTSDPVKVRFYNWDWQK